MGSVYRILALFVFELVFIEESRNAFTRSIMEKRGLGREYYEYFDGDLDELAYHSDAYVQRFWQRMKIRSVVDKVDSDKVILDLGSGSGIISNLLSGGNIVVPLDISLKCIRNCHQISHSLLGTVGDAIYLPFKDGSFDVVVCVEVIEHLVDYKDCLNEIYRVLKPNGKLILTTPNYNSLWPLVEYLWDMYGKGRNYHFQHISKFNKKKLLDVLDEAGFITESLRTFFYVSPFTALISQKLTSVMYAAEQLFDVILHKGMLMITENRKKL